jgi:hypothetical protein
VPKKRKEGAGLQPVVIMPYSFKSSTKCQGTTLVVPNKHKKGAGLQPVVIMPYSFKSSTKCQGTTLVVPNKHKKGSGLLPLSWQDPQDHRILHTRPGNREPSL